MVNHTEQLPNLRHGNNTHKLSKTTNNICYRKNKKNSNTLFDLFIF